MESSGQQDLTGAGTPGDADVEAAALSVERAASAQHVDQVVTPAGDAIASNTDDLVLNDSGDQAADEPTAVHGAIPPLLTDVTEGNPDPVVIDAEAPTTIGAPASKERIADAAAAARDRVAESTSGAREKAAEGASQVREKGAEAAAVAKEKGSEAAAQAREKTSKARKRFSAAASEARERASSAASDARERASNTDVKEFAHSTTSLIDTARPFFLAGCAAIFAVLGFLEGDAGTAQVFAVGALLFVIGAAFSGEINAFLGARSHPRGPARKSADED